MCVKIFVTFYMMIKTRRLIHYNTVYKNTIWTEVLNQVLQYQ